MLQPRVVSSRRTMGCRPSKTDVSPPATTTTRQEMSQPPRSPLAPAVPVARAASHSSQRSRANSEHRPLQGGDVPKPKRPRSNSNPSQKRQPMTFDEDVPPVPSHARPRTKSAFASSSSRNTNTPPSAGECYRRWSAYLPH